VPQFVHTHALAAPSLSQRFHRHIKADFVAKLETICHSASDVCDTHGHCTVSPYAYIVAAIEYALANKGAILLPEEFKRQLDAVREPPVTA